VKEKNRNLGVTGGVMSKENEFLIFAVEYYRNKKKLTGLQIAELFSKYHIYQMIIDNYFSLSYRIT